jgi:hypothetical protein
MMHKHCPISRASKITLYGTRALFDRKIEAFHGAVLNAPSWVGGALMGHWALLLLANRKLG